MVADNGSDDDSAAFLRKHYPQVELLLLDKNYGYAEGYNRALEQVAADCYVLLNSDVEVEEGWLGPLAKLMASDERIAALAPKILSYDRPGYFEYAGASGGFLDAFGYPFCRGRILDTIEQDDGQYDTSRDVFWASGACMMVRADVFRKLGGFDGDFFAHMEEIDFAGARSWPVTGSWSSPAAGYSTSAAGHYPITVRASFTSITATTCLCSIKTCRSSRYGRCSLRGWCSTGCPAFVF